MAKTESGLQTQHHRRTWLAASGDELHAGPWARQLLRALREDEQGDPRLRLAAVLLEATGADEVVLVYALACMRVADVTREAIAIPCDPQTARAGERAVYRLALPAFAQTLFWRWRRSCGAEHEWLIDLGEDRLDRRRKVLREHLVSQLRQWAGQGRPNHLPMLAQGARMSLLERGLPGLWLTPLQQLPLPMSPMNSLWVGSAGPGVGALGRSGAALRHGPPPRARGQSVPEPVAIADEPEAGERSALVVDAVVRELKVFRGEFFKEDHWREHGVKTGSHSRLDELVDNTLAQLESLEGSGTSLAVAGVLWCQELALQGQHKRSTILSYSYQIMRRRHLYGVYAVDVTDWDGGTGDDILDEIRSIGLRNSSLSRTCGIWNRFARWLEHEGWLAETVTFGGVQGRRGESRHRSQIVRPANLDEMVARVLDGGPPDPLPDQSHPAPASDYEQALAGALGFYAGMRAQEVCELRLADVVIEPCEQTPDLGALIGDGEVGAETNNTRGPSTQLAVFLIIRRGKTPAARRRLPLHLLWPPRYTKALVQWVEHRRGQFKARLPHQQGLFGPSGDPRRHHRKALIEPAMAWLRETVGVGVDFHALRHSAATYWFLRVHAGEFPDFRQHLNDQQHWVFEAGSCEAFLRGLCSPAPQRTMAQGLEFQVLARLIGHSSIETTLHTYAHSLSMIHGDWLKRVFSNHAGGRQRGVPWQMDSV